MSSQDGFVSVWDIRYISTSTQTSPLSNPLRPASTRLGNHSSPSTLTFAHEHLLRDPTKLAVLGSYQHPQVKGACRSVKFSPSASIDLMAFTEHVSYINLVDARTFESRQTLRVSPPGVDMHLSGLAWSPDCRGLFVGLWTILWWILR